MAKALTLEQAAKLGLYTVFASALLIIGPIYGARMAHDPTATPSMRWLGVFIAAASVIPWLGYVGWGISIADEYNRRTLVMATAIAFALAILYSMTAQLLVEARLVAHPIGMSLPIAFVLWMIAGGAVVLYEKMRGIR
jgi:hypothetical protein